MPTVVMARPEGVEPARTTTEGGSNLSAADIGKLARLARAASEAFVTPLLTEAQAVKR